MTEVQSSRYVYTMPTLKTTTGQNCLAHKGALLWSGLLTEIKDAKFYDMFRKKLKKQNQT